MEDESRAVRSGQTPGLLGITLEEYFHVGAFRNLIARDRWYRFEPRLEAATDRTLSLLRDAGVSATFFTSGWVAEGYPELVRRVAEAGHEIANSGYAHRGIREQSVEALLEDFERSRVLLEQAGGRRVVGTRIPDWIGPDDLRVLDHLIDADYRYDASLRVMGPAWPGRAKLTVPFQHRRGGESIWEIPVPAARVAGMLVPIGGGNWFRQLPESSVRRAVASWRERHAAPFSMYFQVWELDAEQPRISAAPFLTRIRQYRNLDRMTAMLPSLLAEGTFTSMADHLGIPRDAVAPAPRESTVVVMPVSDAATTLSVVVPCHDEADTLPYLWNTLASVADSLKDRYRLHLVFVDDASQDETWTVMQQLAGDRSDCTLVRHPQNRGVAHAILSGLAAAPSEFVCSIDADCTYDPHQIAALMVPLEAGAHLVTASPYHPDGRVLNVPGWRLLLSRTLTRFYRVVLGASLRTYTSCFRAYRRSAVVDLRLRHTGFLAVAEMLARMILDGRKVAEVPATLEARLLGQSKMKVVRVIMGHLRLLAQLARERSRGPAPGTPDSEAHSTKAVVTLA